MFKVSELVKVTGGNLTRGPRDALIKGISIDTRTIKKGEAFIAIKGENFDGHDFIREAIKKGAKAIIVQKSQVTSHKSGKIAFIAVKDTQKALGDIACLHRKRFNIPVIAVTGSSGKTTTKEMIAWILSRQFKVLKNEGTKNNHIGVPLTLLNLQPSHDLAVLELGTNHFGEIEYLSKICLPNVGVITNIGPAHLENFHDLSGVFKEKFTLIERLKNPCIAVLNADDELWQKKIAVNKKAVIFGFGMKNKCDFRASNIRYTGKNLEFLLNAKHKIRLNTLGNYNIYNTLAAVAIARIFGIDYKDIARQFITFEFPKGRLNIVTLNNIRFIDDTYNSNPLSLNAALSALDKFSAGGRKIFVMGDMLELGKFVEIFHEDFGPDIARICDKFISVGEYSRITADAAKASGLDTKDIFTCNTAGEAREILFKEILPNKNDVVLVKGSRRMRMEEILDKVTSQKLQNKQRGRVKGFLT